MNSSFVRLAMMAATFLISLVAEHSEGLAIQQAPNEPDEISKKDFLKWVDSNAIPVERWKMNDKLETYLDNALAEKRFVFIGEPGHFYSERIDVQLLLIRYLVSKGYHHIFHEGLGASMAPAFDHFVLTGRKPDSQEKSDAVSRYQNRAFESWTGAKTTEFKTRVSASRNRFFKGLHEINQALPPGLAKLRIHPLDIDMMPGGCYSSIDLVLSQYTEEDGLIPVRQLVARAENETVTEEIARLEKLRALVRDNRGGILNVLKPQERKEMEKFVDCLLESIVFLDTARKDGKLDNALVRREPAMFRQVQHALNSIPADAKAIMIAHNNHLCKKGADITRARKPSVGEMIDQAFPGEVFSIWMLHDHGMLLDPTSKEPIQRLESDPQRIESTLVDAGSTYFLPLHSGEAGEGYLSKKWRHSYFTWYETGTLTKQTDAIFFLDVVTPLRK